MPQLTFLLFICGLFLFSSSPLIAAPQTLAAKQNQVRVAIMGQADFHPDRTVTGNVKSLPDGLAARIIEQLSATKRFEVVERTALRRVIREQQFGAAETTTDLDQVIEKTVDNLPKVNGWTVAAASTAANHNDRLKEFKALGTTVGADYLVYAVLEKHQSSHQTQAIPYSESNKVQRQTEVDARLRLRVIETALGRIVGADSIHTRISETAFSGKHSSMDAYSMYDQLGAEAAISVLDMIFPAAVVSQSPWVINRGSDQFIEVGDRYTLIREGKEIKDADNISIGRIRTESGLVEVTQVQSNLSVVTLLNGDIATTDLAVPAPADKPSKSVVAAPPLNQALANNQSRPRLAIGLVKSLSTASSVNKHLPHFTDTLISRLSQTKRFQLIDRQEVDQLLNEQVAQAMAENGEMPSALGQLKGADYLVIGSVASFVIEEKTRKLPGSSRIILTSEGVVEGNMRVVDARSGDILESKKVSVTQHIPKAGTQHTLLAKLADAYADQVTVNLMNAIYPIKVAAVVSGVAYINRGNDGGLAVGEVLHLMRPGQAILDPDTGVKLGVAETKLGELTLVTVDPAKSTALAEDLPIQVGDTLKRSASRKGSRSHQAASKPLRTGANAESTSDTPITLVIGNVRINPRSHKIVLDQGHTSRMTNDLMVKMSQFPEFDIMERDQIDQVIDEKTFTSISNQTSLDSSLQALMGADYLVNTAIDVFKVRSETKKIPYTDEFQTVYFGTAEATARVIDVHTGKLASAIKIRMNERLGKTEDQSLAFDDLIDRFSSQLASGISDDLNARQNDTLKPTSHSQPITKKPQPKVNRPNF